jgi:ferricrocin synthase
MDEALTDIVRRPNNRADSIPGSLPALPTASASVSSADHINARPTEVSDLTADEEFSIQEAIIRDAVVEVAGLAKEKIGRRMPLYMFGIDSISAMQLVSHCRRHGLKIAIADVLSGMHIQGTLNSYKTRVQAKDDLPRASISVAAHLQELVIEHLRVDPVQVETILPVLPVSHIPSRLCFVRLNSDIGYCRANSIT